MRSRSLPLGALTEFITPPGRTLRKLAEDVLAYFDRPGTFTGQTEKIDERWEHLRGSAPFPDLLDDIARRLLETSGFGPRLHPRIVMTLTTYGPRFVIAAWAIVTRHDEE